MPNITPKNRPNSDQIIILIGEQLDKLYHELKEVQPRSMESVELKSLEDSLFYRMVDLANAVAALPASTPEAVAIQLRVLNNELHGDDMASERRSFLLIESILGFVQGQGGPSRADYAGEYYLREFEAFKTAEA